MCNLKITKVAKTRKLFIVLLFTARRFLDFDKVQDPCEDRRIEEVYWQHNTPPLLVA